MSFVMCRGTPDVGAVVGGRYRIVRLIGGGGMSTVFEAENTFTNKRVAVKWLLATLATRPGARERMLREARIGSRIKHRHVVDIYDVGFEGESMFLVMALLEGETLANALETRTMSIPAFLNLLLPVLRGVMEAHRLGVVHRDIKPDNIMLAREVDQPEPVPMVLDFGIAKMDGDMLRTHTGSAQGTPAFMASEQIRGLRDLDGRVDVYAFGVILYMALAGRMPIIAETWPELIYKLTTTEVLPLSTLRPELPSALGELVARALERDREQRTPSLEQLIRELVPFASAADSLGDTRLVEHPAALVSPAPQHTTEPASGAWATPEVTAVLATGSVHDVARELEPRRAAVAASSSRASRLRVLLPAALAVIGLLAVAGSRVAAPRPHVTPQVQLAQARAEPMQPSAQQTAPPVTQATMALASPNVAALAPVHADAGALPRLEARTTRPLAAHPRVSPRARRVLPATPPVLPVPTQNTRRRLSQDEFFGASR